MKKERGKEYTLSFVQNLKKKLKKKWKRNIKESLIFRISDVGEERIQACKQFVHFGAEGLARLFSL